EQRAALLRRLELRADVRVRRDDHIGCLEILLLQHRPEVVIRAPTEPARLLLRALAVHVAERGELDVLALLLHLGPVVDVPPGHPAATHKPHSYRHRLASPFAPAARRSGPGRKPVHRSALYRLPRT